MTKNKKHVAAIAGVKIYLDEAEKKKPTIKLMWTDHRSVGWMNKPRNK
jgi:hypothetical protein